MMNLIFYFILFYSIAFLIYSVNICDITNYSLNRNNSYRLIQLRNMNKIINVSFYLLCLKNYNIHINEPYSSIHSF